MRPPNRVWFLTLLALAGPATAAAQGPIDDSQAQEASAQESAAAEIESIIAEYKEAYDAFLKTYRAAGTDEARQKAVDELLPDASKYAVKLWEIVEANPGSDPSLDAIVWISQSAGSMKNSERAVEALAMHYMDDERAALILQRVYLTEKCLEPAQAILEGSENDANRAHACFALANYWKSQSEAAYTDNDELLAKAEAYLVRVTEDFADLPSRGGTMGEAAERELFEIRNLAIGMPAPEIAGEDLDGVAFKLSDYRGKVVVLDFWGDW